MRTLSFRRDTITGMPVKALDLLAHCAVSAALVWMVAAPKWGFALQWMPDVFLPVIWLWSMTTGKYLPPGNVFLKLHKALHSGQVMFPMAVVFLAVGLFLGLMMPLFVGFQLLTHEVIDEFTHEEGERQ